MVSQSERNRVVLGITGSIAAYKSAEYARLLVSRGFEVRVVMTESAQEFISPTTFQAITGKPVVTTFWEEANPAVIGHIEIADWADVVVVAPATADFLAKVRMGAAETPLLALILATKAPIVIAPAMNTNMLEHARTQENLKVIAESGVTIVEPEEGALACGWKGSGRMASPWEIFHHTVRAIGDGDYVNKRVLVVTGPTREPIDPVRFLSNRSSGKMGMAMATEAFRRGAEVAVIHGPIRALLPAKISRQEVFTAQQMYDAVVEKVFGEGSEAFDYIVMAAAVADFRPKQPSELKIKRSEQPKSLALVENPDILAELGKRRGEETRPVLVGFAVETGEIEALLEAAGDKLRRKKADIIVGNFAEDAFDLDTNRVWIIDRHGKREEVATTFKTRVANKILDAMKKQ
ncbi:MAG: bifunctional phosphopantothenoylcysteine decarboxylase/phosphopantothenate--cysteine ligase CoaBC [Bdellovibrionales bacterium]|nr:bifunctional phosphopantothenoylcysteine decarboxylase/phosphopantothenate--cysteine ligase CoaBC [Bdellovibrionales bacterium]